MFSRRIFEQELDRAQVEVTPEERVRLLEFLDLVLHWNQRINLTALANADLVRRFVIEPVVVGRKLQMAGILVDVGSGAGCPGVSLCITGRFTEAHLVEPRLKRAVFLRNVVQRLKLEGVVVEKERIESLALAVPPDWITMQAIAPKGDIVAALRRMGSPTTRVVWITGESSASAPVEQQFALPRSSTLVRVFRLDQS